MPKIVNNKPRKGWIALNYVNMYKKFNISEVNCFNWQHIGHNTDTKRIVKITTTKNPNP